MLRGTALCEGNNDGMTREELHEATIAADVRAAFGELEFLADQEFSGRARGREDATTRTDSRTILHSTPQALRQYDT